MSEDYAAVAASATVQQLIKNVDIPQAVTDLREGAYLYKWCSNQIKKPHQRLYWFDTDELALKWNSPKKKSAQSIVYFSDVTRILPGSDSEFSRYKERRKYGIDIQSYSNLRIACESLDQWKIWMAGLLHLYARAMKRQSLNRSSAFDTLYGKWEDMKLGSLGIHSMNVVLRNFNISIDRRYLELLFFKYDKDNAGVLEKDMFDQLLEECVLQRGVQDVFLKYADDKSRCISPDGYRQFLTDIQRERDGDLIDQSIIQLTSLPEPFYIPQTGLTEMGFSLLLSSPQNDLLHPAAKEVHEDMNQPLSSYWIASSHNTYLTGDQVIGKSAVGQYIDVLLRGCRCVELDVYDGPDNNPILFHGIAGYPLTGSIKFSSVIQACKDYAFTSSPYPVILSLEVHCSTKGIRRIGEILEEKLGDRIFSYDPDAALPSPEMLKYKFLVKAKISNEMEGELEESTDEELQELAEVVSGEIRTNQNSDGTLEVDNRRLKDTEGIRKYAKCISFLTKKMFDSDAEYAPMVIFSFSENRYSKLVKSDLDGLLELTGKHIVRVYPSATRLASSNFNPLPLWLNGVQLVALNYQSLGLATILAEGRFALNGGRTCGYVLKRRNANSAGYAAVAGKLRMQLNENPIKLTIQVISAHQVPYYNIDKNRNGNSKNKIKDCLSPIVTVRVHGERYDRKHFKTSAVSNNGFNPLWKSEFSTFAFDIRSPTAAVLVFLIRQSDSVKSDIVGAAAMPISHIRSGIRWIPLFDAKFRYLPFSGLLVRCGIRPLNI